METKLKNYEIIVQIGLCAAWADDNIHAKERILLNELAKTLKLELPMITSSLSLPDLKNLCDGLKSERWKFEALEFASKVLVSDGKIENSEIAFVEKLYSLLGFEVDNFEKYMNYLFKSAEAEFSWYEFKNCFNKNE
jgi:hypothetical protein